MRKKLLQHTLLVAVAVWAMHLAHGPNSADTSLTAGPFAAQTMAMR